MPTGYRKASVDFESLFDPDVVGDGPTVPLLKKAGVPLRFADIRYGSKGPDVGIRQGGVDISNIWAAAGTASYIDSNALPAAMSRTVIAPSGTVNCVVSFQFNRDGSMSLVPTVYQPRNWHTPNSTAFGDDYEIRFTATGGGTGSLSGSALGTWLVINGPRGITFTVSQSTTGANTGTRTLLTEIRRVGGTAILYSHSMPMTGTAEIS